MQANVRIWYAVEDAEGEGTDIGAVCRERTHRQHMTPMPLTYWTC
jgi:hypothetical protein